MEVPLSETFFTRRLRMLTSPDCFMLYGKVGVDSFSTSDLLYPRIKVKLRLIRARPNFCRISDNLNVSLGIVDCLLYTCHFALKHDYGKKQMDMVDYTPVECNYLETLAKACNAPVGQKEFVFRKAFLTKLHFVELQKQ